MKWPLLFFVSFLFLTKASAQDAATVDFKHLQAIIHPSPSEKKVSGELLYSFDVLIPTDSIFSGCTKNGISGGVAKWKENRIFK